MWRQLFRFQFFTWVMASFVLRSRVKAVSKVATSKIKVENSEQPPTKRPRKKSPIKISYEEDGKDKCKVSRSWQPDNWVQMVENIKQMRSKKDAPVDTMGCHKCSDETLEPKVYRWQILVSLMLSSQTKDQITYAAMARLRDFGLTVDNILRTEMSVLQTLIYPVGFYKRKAEYIKKTAQILKDKYESDIPPTIEALCELPGVGPKMGHLCMQNAWGQLTGIGVDTHVHRIANRLKWVKTPTKSPEATRTALQEWMPKELWTSINLLLVGFGQQTCLPSNPKCQLCLNKDICPSSKYNSSC